MSRSRSSSKRRHKPQRVAARPPASKSNTFFENLKEAAEQAAPKAASRPDQQQHQHADPKAVHASHEQVRLLDKNEVRAIVGVSFPTIWQWMRRGLFPRSRICRGRSVWRSDEIENWLARLPVRPLKGDAPEEAA